MGTYMSMKFAESGCTSLNLHFGPYCFLPHFLAQTGCYGSQKGFFLTCRPKKAHCFLLGWLLEDHTLASSLVAALVSPPSRGKGHDSSPALPPILHQQHSNHGIITPVYTQKYEVQRFYTEPEAHGRDLQPPPRLQVICFHRSRLLDLLLN